jgi:glycosyltransferase involved in cell wall biosynthesis
MKERGVSKSTSQVSVIIPAYDVTAYIVEALESVLGQTYPAFEILIVNDGCPDTVNLERALEPYRGRITYIKQVNGGVSRARNSAIRAASSAFIACLDGDDVWESRYLEIQMSILEADLELSVVYPNATIFGGPGEGTTIMELCPSVGEVTFQSLVSRQCHVFTGITARREALLRAGLYDEDLRSAEDYDLWLRMTAMGMRFAYHRQSLVRYRRSRTGSLSQNPAMLQNVLRVYEKLRAALDLSPEDRHALESALVAETAMLNLLLGKKALYAGDWHDAAEKLRQANRILQRRNITLSLWLLRIAPGLLRKYVHHRYPTERSFVE